MKETINEASGSSWNPWQEAMADAISVFDSRLATGRFVSEEKLAGEEDAVSARLDDEVDVIVERETSENYALQGSEDEARASASRWLNNAFNRVCENSAAEAENGTFPSVRTSANHLIAKEFKKLLIKKKAGSLTDADRSQIGLSISALSIVRYHAELAEDEACKK